MSKNQYWNQERIEFIKTKWNDGWTSRRIAEALGGTTRNAILGKLHRIRNSKGSPAFLRERRIQEKPARCELEAGSRLPKIPRQNRKVGENVNKPSVGLGRIRASKGSLPFLREGCIQEKPSNKPSARLGVMDLTNFTCRWPEGDVRNGGIYFCGDMVYKNSSYCHRHTLIACSPGH